MTCSVGQTHRQLPLSGKAILIANDDGAGTIASKFRALGASVASATTLEDALLPRRRHPPSLAIIDLELGGRETGPLRQACYERHVAFVVYTALHHRPFTGRWTAMPVLYKPDECGELERTVLRLSEKPWPIATSS